MKDFFKKLIAISLASLLLFGAAGCSFINRSAAFLRRVTAEKNDKLVDCSATRKFYYDQLSEEEQLNYRLLLAAYQRMDDEVTGLTLPVKDMIRINKFIALDCPELFWVANSGVYYDENLAPLLYMGGRYKPRYRYSREQVAKLTMQIDAVCDAFARGHENDSDYEKALAAYEYIIDSTEYDNETADVIISKKDYDPLTDDSQCIVSVFVGRKSVCAGYSAAYQYLLRRLGVFAVSIIGTVRNIETSREYNHEWSALELDGEWYYTDITWGEPEAENRLAEYSYFCVTSEEMTASHKPNDWAEYPESEAIDCNWFYRSGGYLEQLDIPRIGSYIINAVRDRDEYLSLKFAGKRDYAALKEYLQYATGKAVGVSRYLRYAADNYAYMALEKTTFSAIDDLKIVRLHFTYRNGEET